MIRKELRIVRKPNGQELDFVYIDDSDTEEGEDVVQKRETAQEMV